MLRKRIIKLIFKVILIIVFFGTPVCLWTVGESTIDLGGEKTEIDALNAKIAEKKEAIKKLEASIEDYKQKIQQKRLEAVSLSNQTAILDNRIAQVELDIRATEEKLSSLNLEIQALELMIGEKEKAIAKQKIILGELVRSIQRQEGKSYLVVVAAYDNFSDFFDKIQHLETVQQDLGASVRALQGVRTELADKKTQTEERQARYQELKETLDQKRFDLQEQIQIKQTLLVQTSQSEAKFNTLLLGLREQYQAIESEINAIEKEVRDRLSKEEQEKLEESDSGGQLSWPSQTHYITSEFHDPEYPYRHIFEHSGIDLRVGHGSSIKAAASGYVARARVCGSSSCYSYIMLIHNSGLATVYGHLSKILVNEDQFVTRGDVIALSGGTPGTIGAGPFVTGAHLHFEVRKNGIPVNPLLYLN